MKYLGVDYGSKKIGLAVSDHDGIMAFPRVVIPRVGAVAYLEKLVEEEGIETIVLGDSLTAHGQENPVMIAAHDFITELEKQVQVPIVLCNEYGTSGAARSLRDYTEGLPRRQSKPRRGTEKPPLDASAAAIMLQRYLESGENRDRGTV